MSEQDKQQGLYQKYMVSRSDGTPVPPEAKYFVLRYDRPSDIASRAALRAYSGAISRDFPELAKDLRTLLAELEK